MPLVIDVQPHVDGVAAYPTIIVKLLVAAAGIELYFLMVATMGATNSLTFELHSFLLRRSALCLWTIEPKLTT
jgi:hypothetical protein